MSASGASKVTLRGRARTADITLAGACKLVATEMSIDEADVKAVGASKAELGKVRNLRKTALGVSKIDTQE